VRQYGVERDVNPRELFQLEMLAVDESHSLNTIDVVMQSCWDRMR
jgi:hypothetical protein